jgi:hypothetical protein
LRLAMMTRAASMAAVTAVAAQIAIPLPFSPVPFTLQVLAVILSAFEVTAFGAAGPEFSGSAYWNWTVETFPETTIDSGPPVWPPDYVRSTSASFSFSSDSAGATFQCKRDTASSFATCRSPQNYSSLSQGKHTFQVRAVNTAGKPDPDPASRTWFVDTVLPKGTIAINGKDASTKCQSVRLYLSASDPSPASGVASMRFRNENTTT